MRSNNTNSAAATTTAPPLTRDPVTGMFMQQGDVSKDVFNKGRTFRTNECCYLLIVMIKTDRFMSYCHKR